MTHHCEKRDSMFVRKVSMILFVCLFVCQCPFNDGQATILCRFQEIGQQEEEMGVNKEGRKYSLIALYYWPGQENKH